jgi:hypothetical protein
VLQLDERFKYVVRRCLLSLFLALPHSNTLELPSNGEFDLNHIVVVGTALAIDHVCRIATELFLGILLQFALVVLMPLIEDGLLVIPEAMQDRLIDRLQRTIKIDGGDERFEGIGEE